MTKKKTQPRPVPDRDSKYIGLAWIHAGFSKDPSTQVGAVIVTANNFPLGSGYNGPPRRMNDSTVVWDRPPKDEPDAVSKYDLMVHAEINAIHHCGGTPLEDTTLYVTALPCPACMLHIVREGISRVVYTNFQSNKNSMLQNASWREKSLYIAKSGGVTVEEFKGSLGWIGDWTLRLKELGVFEMGQNT